MGRKGEKRRRKEERRRLAGRSFVVAQGKISDEVVEQVGEFLAGIELAGFHGETAEEGEVEMVDDEDDEHIQELTDMGVLARDLVRRIQRLRGNLRPGSAAAAALPDIRMDGDDAGDISGSAVGAIGVEGPVIEDMD